MARKEISLSLLLLFNTLSKISESFMYSESQCSMVLWMVSKIYKCQQKRRKGCISFFLTKYCRPQTKFEHGRVTLDSTSHVRTKYASSLRFQFHQLTSAILQCSAQQSGSESAGRYSTILMDALFNQRIYDKQSKTPVMQLMCAGPERQRLHIRGRILPPSLLSFLWGVLGIYGIFFIFKIWLMLCFRYLLGFTALCLKVHSWLSLSCKVLWVQGFTVADTARCSFPS